MPTSKCDCESKSYAKELQVELRQFSKALAQAARPRKQAPKPIAPVTEKKSRVKKAGKSVASDVAPVCKKKGGKSVAVACTDSSQ